MPRPASTAGIQLERLATLEAQYPARTRDERAHILSTKSGRQFTYVSCQPKCQPTLQYPFFFFLLNRRSPSFFFQTITTTTTIITHFSPRRSRILITLLMAPTTYKDKRYTIVFKDDVNGETVAKYMTDVVDAGGRVTQTYDWFLNGFCAAIPEVHLQLLSKNTEVDYIEPEGLPKRL